MLHESSNDYRLIDPAVTDAQQVRIAIHFVSVSCMYQALISLLLKKGKNAYDNNCLLQFFLSLDFKLLDLSQWNYQQ